MVRPSFAIIVLLILADLPARACNVPVFRYAIERWPADPYRITLASPGSLDDPARAIADALARSQAAGANITVESIDAARPSSDEFKDLLAAAKPAKLPALVVQYPEHSQLNQAFWVKPLDPKHAGLMVHSPARRDLAMRLLKGDSAVWLFLDSGDRAKDDAAAALLATTLDKLQKELKLPEPDPDDPRMAANVPLKITFSILRIARTDPAEQFLVASLLGVDRRLADVPGPLVFPCFGRGRALACLAGPRLTEDSISEAAQFMVGPCSCEVKNQNPGIDLLVTADWDALIEQRVVKDPELPALISLSGFGLPSTAPAPIAATPADPPLAAPLYRRLMLILAACAVALVVGTILILRRSSRSAS